MPSALPSAGHERLETAHRNSLRLLKLVNTLLDFSRIEAGRTQASYEPTQDKDRLNAYTHFANSYVIKPVDYDQFVTAASQLGLYRLVLNAPPPRKRGADLTFSIANFWSAKSRSAHAPNLITHSCHSNLLEGSIEVVSKSPIRHCNAVGRKREMGA